MIDQIKIHTNQENLAMTNQTYFQKNPQKS